MNGSGRIYNQAYRCRDKEMFGDLTRVYRSIYADSLSLPYYMFPTSSLRRFVDTLFQAIFYLSI